MLNYQLIKNSLQLDCAGKWLVKDSEDDFFPDALNFSDISQHLSKYISQREHRLLQLDSLPHLVDSVPKSNGMLREAVWLHPTHRLLYLGVLHYLLPKLDHHLPPEVYSYRKDRADQDQYPFPDKMGRWKIFHNDFRQACLDEQTKAVLITDIASFYDHIRTEEMCNRIRTMLGDGGSRTDFAIVDFLDALLRQWSTNGYGIPQNVDASSFFGSLFLSGVDREILDKRYRYFRWVDDIRICAGNKKQATRALHDLQNALARHRLFLASDKTKIILKGTKEFEQLLDVTDDSYISRLEDVVARGSRNEIKEEIPKAQERLEFHAGLDGDDRKFRAFANRLIQIGEYKEFRKQVHDHLSPFVYSKLETYPNKSDYWSKMLQEDTSGHWREHVDKLLRADPSIYNWQRFYLWKLLTAQENISPDLLARAKSTINNPISDLEAYQAIICIGRHGDSQTREALFVQYFSPQRSYPIQRAILIAMQEIERSSRDRFYERALQTCPEHSQLVEYLKGLNTPLYGIKLRAQRDLPAQPREVKVELLRGVGKVNGEVIRYRLSRADYDYE